MKIKEFKPNMKLLTTEIVLGPQREIFRELDFINGQYFQQGWLYGNRSTLEPIDPLRITKKFRWGAGYKERIIEVIETRFNQYHKKTSALSTLIKGRPERMQYDKRRFISKLIKLDEDMRNLRANGFTMDSNVEHFETKLEEITTEIESSLKAFNKFASNEPIKCNIRIETIPDKEIENFRATNAPNRTFSKDEIEVIRYQNSYLFFEIEMLKPVLKVTDGDRQLGTIPLKSTTVILWIKMEELLNVMSQKTKISDIQVRDFRERNVQSRRHNFNLSSSVLHIPNTSNYGMGAIYPHETSSRENSNDTILAHPFIGRSYRGTTVPLEYYEAWRNTCLGSTGTEIWTNLLKCDFIGLYLMLIQWQTYNMSSTSPLNNIKLAHFGMPGHYSEAFKNAVGCDTNRCNKRLSYYNNEYSITERTNLLQVYNDMQYQADKEQILNNTSSIQSYCDKIECQFRDTCNGYIQRRDFFLWLENGQPNWNLDTNIEQRIIELYHDPNENINDEEMLSLENSNDEWSVLGISENALDNEESDETINTALMPGINTTTGWRTTIGEHFEDVIQNLNVEQDVSMSDAIADIITDNPNENDLPFEFPDPDNMTDEERTQYEMQLWAHAQRGGRDV